MIFAVSEKMCQQMVVNNAICLEKERKIAIENQILRQEKESKAVSKYKQSFFKNNDSIEMTNIKKQELK